MTEGYKALTRAAGVFDLSARTRIRVTGEDRARLLHALTTNHVQELLPGHGCYAFFLNANGRVIADANLFAFPEHILMDAEPEVRELLWAHLDHYIIADDATPHDDGEATFCLGVEGPAAAERLGALGAPVPGNDFAHESWNDLTVARVSFTGEPGFRLFGPAERKTAVVDLLYLIPATAEDVERVRIERGKPRYGVDITSANIAAETGVTRALHTSKGCYIGQEIVERVRSRGHVNKQLVSMLFDGPVERGARVMAGGKEVGEVTSAAGFSALGYVRVPHEQPGSAIEVNGVLGRVR